MAAESDSESTFKPGRKLCPDGSCIGVIGSDGRCTVCGTSDAGAADGPVPNPTDVQEDAGGEAIEPEAEDSESGFDSNRRLCSDESCIGVIGEDNRCRHCGKSAVS
jgi:hypothetical protein